MFSGMFKKKVRVVHLTLPLLHHLKINNNNQMGTFVSCLQEDLSAPSELSGSTDNLSVNSNTKVKFVKASPYIKHTNSVLIL